ncbi:helix-turn-helix domain-containing protein [Kibdelosporangium philippinense]|uniref:Helix-turn-helix domain-containing protein n=1 Tax=Kibdelosporangium philippinense TaxID=211113 RepID=A0ABS8ZS39_9PSEU|nr:helix-turn-helix domain-containing protein [Kibdelosporangium philippinense]MCE7010048.1 helix-turn-helix domain-containing protein [Kibdelosporangium philippinense]
MSTERPRDTTPLRGHQHQATDTPETGDSNEPIVPLYTPAQAAQLLAVKESWLRRKASARAIPCTFLGKHLRFSTADIRAIVTASARPTRAPAGRPRRR